VKINWLDKQKRISVGSLLLFFCFSTTADDLPRFEGWARASPQGASNASVYGKFFNPGRSPVRLESIEFSGSEIASVHKMIDKDGMLGMRPGELIVGAQESVRLEPGGMHIMLMKLNAPLFNGCAYSLIFKWAGGKISAHKFFVGEIDQSTPPLFSDSCLN